MATPTSPAPAPPVAAAPRPSRFASWLRRMLVEPELPLLAVELRPASIGVLRLAMDRGRRVIGAAACLDLPEGALTASLVPPASHDRDTLVRTLRAALEKAGAASGGPAALVIPDPCTRLTMVPAAEVPDGTREQVDEVLRFKLRRLLPFDTHDARIALVRGPRPADQVLVSVAHRAVVESLESMCAEVGLQPGFVQPSGAALLFASVASHPAGDGLVVNWDGTYVTIFLVRDGWPVLQRTLGDGASTRVEQVTREVGSTVLYYRDRLAGTAMNYAHVRSAVVEPQEAVEAISRVLGFPATVVEPWPGLETGLASQMIAGAAAALVVPEAS